MESANLHARHHHLHQQQQQQQQLQDQLLLIHYNQSSSPLPTTTTTLSSSSSSSPSSCYGLGTPTPAPPSWSSSNHFLNSGSYSPNSNGSALLNSRDPNINATAMIQDLGFHWSIKDELSSDSNYPKFTETINTSPSSSIEDLHLHNLNDQRNLNDMMSEKLFLRNFNGLHLPPPDNFYSNSNPHNGTSTSAPSRATFSQIFPSINISNFGQSSSIISNSLGMSLEALDLFNSPRFSGSFSQPSSHDQLGDLSYNGVDHLQQWSHRPTTSPSKTSTFRTTTTAGATEAKRRSSSFMEPTKVPQAAAPKKSRLDSRASCPPFKVRKEKLGDRIAALQQLVAPFGKTDTASVLMEAIGYIKFLQNQVETLSVPYMKSSRNKTSRTMQGVSTEGHGHGHEHGYEEGKTDLRRRGLCLVPMSCLSYVTDGGGGVWAPPDFSGPT